MASKTPATKVPGTKAPKAPKKGGAKKGPNKMVKTPTCVTVTSPATLSVRDIIGAISELAPKVKSSKICDYLVSKGFKVTEPSVRAYKASLNR